MSSHIANVDMVTRIDSYCSITNAICTYKTRHREYSLHCLLDRYSSQSKNPKPYANAMLFLISAIAFAGFRPFGQVREQLRMVWHL